MPGVSTTPSLGRYSSYSSYPSYRTSSITSSIGRTSSLERSGYAIKDNISIRTPYKSTYGSNYQSSSYSGHPPKSYLNDNYRSSKSLRVSPVRSSYSRFSSDYADTGASDISRESRYSTGRRRESSSSRDSGYISNHVSKDHVNDYSSYDYLTSKHLLDLDKVDTSTKINERLRAYDTPKLDPVEKRLAERRKRLGLSPTKDTPSRPNLPRYRKPEENGTSNYTSNRYSTYRNESRLVGNSDISYSTPGRSESSRFSGYSTEYAKEINGRKRSTSPELKLGSKLNLNDVSSSISRQNSYNKLENRRAVSPVQRTDKIKDEEPTFSRKRLTSGSNSSFNENDGLIGLRNIGNTCFMNSIVQCLSNTKCVLDYVLHDGYSSDINTTLSTMKGQLIKAFASLLSDMWNGGDSKSPVNTSSFKCEMQRFSPTFIGYAQHDAQEFLRKLLEGLHEDVNRVCTRPKPISDDIDESLDDNQKAMEAWKRYLRYDDSKIVDMFVGQLKSSLQCSVCSHRSVTFDPFWDLSLPIPNKVGQVKLSQCLDLFTKEEVLDNHERPTCSRCKERRRMTKSFSIQKFPRVLVLHLKRFSPTERWRGKLGCMVEFPLDNLDLSKFASNSSISCQYRLIGIANHSGTAFSGHYTAYCRHPYMSTWHEYNDSRVSNISTTRVCSPEAYVLFYELTAS